MRKSLLAQENQRKKDNQKILIQMKKETRMIENARMQEEETVGLSSLTEGNKMKAIQKRLDIHRTQVQQTVDE